MYADSILTLLDSILKCSQNGRRFAENQYDIDRYGEIEKWVTELYKMLPGFSDIVLEPHDPVRYITPIVGVNAIVINSENKILLEKRKDDDSWCLPGGWCETGLTASENIIKELKEETGYNVEIDRFYKLFCRTPSPQFNTTSYHLVYICSIHDGFLKVSHESEDIAWLKIEEVKNWHIDHGIWVREYIDSVNSHEQISF